MKYEFGVMSNKWELEAENLAVAKLCMCLFIKKNIPIAIYSPKETAFMPEAFLIINLPEQFNSKEVQKAFTSIKEQLNSNKQGSDGGKE